MELKIDQFKPFLKEIWEKTSFEQFTTIQEKAYLPIMEGKDLLAKSPTGSGKTLAYLFPVLQKVDVEKKNTQVVILASSHELVMQIHQEVQNWTTGSGITSGSFIGGANIKRQVEKLKKHPQIVVGTPGRVQELLKMKKMKVHEVKTIVLDEGDQLIVPEHVETIKNIIKSTVSDRQVVLFSATLSEETENKAKEMMNEPEVIRIDKDESLPDVEHSYFLVEFREKFDLLRKLGRVEGLKGIAFVRDIGTLSVLAEKLNYKGVSVGVLHSDANKQERASTIKAFRKGEISLLLATDVAARGLDIQGITHVIHVDIPDEIGQYVHRSGRTGRLGSDSGTVIILATDRDERKLKQIEKELKISLQRKDIVRGNIVDYNSRIGSGSKPNYKRK